MEMWFIKDVPSGAFKNTYPNDDVPGQHSSFSPAFSRLLSQICFFKVIFLNTFNIYSAVISGL